MNPFNTSDKDEIQILKDRIKERCKFQKNFSGLQLAIYFVLQYSVPIFLVVLGGIVNSKDQLEDLLTNTANNEVVAPTQAI